MKVYEVQGKRIPVEPEDEALLKLRKCPLRAEVIVWDGSDIAEVTSVENKVTEILDNHESGIRV